MIQAIFPLLRGDRPHRGISSSTSFDADLYDGDREEEAFSSFSLSEEQKKSYDVVVQKFEAYFAKQRNVIYERARFNQ